mmetsp:Transcript_15382/g.14745  ORF Transcript_15382/g.14745 Transcript_15382/m.14745 type:complete len:139 (+) Transcript_15382:204-620(+)|eukprot:CAMPEP_0119033458 /NCGR_PEP_ID=MMETSP1177-20130426/502_1 /TAXON_ID=2985 /ORGANISM="Ochromonas sp, Strain CCMP1899" /LENGTH=138 /DNA_ID=CAMNT_0006990215 /DNA_START=171 /DNA_END=587 /DNA_ORIENTATION=+
MGDQDWTPVTVTKTAAQRNVGKSTAQAQSQAKVDGTLSTERRFGTSENKSAHSAVGSNLKKLEDSTESFKHTVIDKSLSKAITATRMAKKMTQTDLARAINERPQIIQEYESGKAIPNGAILSKLDKALGTHLPRGKK